MKKWFTREWKRFLFVVFCIVFPMGSVDEAIAAMFPGLSRWDHWRLLLLVMMIISIYFGWFFHTVFKLHDERKAKEEARRKEEKEDYNTGKKKWFTREGKIVLFGAGLLGFLIGSVGEAIEVAFPELSKWNQWRLELLVALFVGSYFGWFFYTVFRLREERKAKEQAIEDAKKKEKEG